MFYLGFNIDLLILPSFLFYSTSTKFCLLQYLKFLDYSQHAAIYSIILQKIVNCFIKPSLSNLLLLHRTIFIFSHYFSLFSLVSKYRFIKYLSLDRFLKKTPIFSKYYPILVKLTLVDSGY